METFREEQLIEVVGVEVTAVEDYLTSIRVVDIQEEAIELLGSNVLKYHLADGSWIALCPSGTEPKVKFYFGVKGGSLEESVEKFEIVQGSLMRKVNMSLGL